MAENILSGSPLLEAQQNAPQLYASPLARLTGAGAYGLTLGAGGIAPETIPEHIAEFVGSVPTIAGLSAVATPAVGAAVRVARLKPLGKLGMAAASNVAVDVPLAAIESQTKDRDFAENLAWNLGASAVGMGILNRKDIGAALRPAANNLQDLSKATTTAVPDLPPPLKPTNILKIDETQGPKIATIGPNIGHVTRPMDPRRVHFPQYAELYDEYGRPLNLAPETRFASETRGFDEYGNPAVIPERVSPEELARRTAPSEMSVQASQAENMLGMIQPEKPFKAQFDPRLSTFVVTPQTKSADDAIRLLETNPSPRNVETQLSPAQQVHLTDPNSEIRKKIEQLKIENERLRTSNLVNKTEEEVQQIVETARPTKAVDIITLKDTRAGKEAEALSAKSGISQEKALAIVKDAELEISKIPFKSERERLAALKQLILKTAQENCV